MQYIVTRQIAIEAETAEEALEKTKPAEGTSISFNVNPRPQQMTRSTISGGAISGTPSISSVQTGSSIS